MNWNIVQGNWKQFKGKLSGDHSDVLAGKGDEVAGKIQETYGVAKDEVEQQIKRVEK